MLGSSNGWRPERVIAFGGAQRRDSIPQEKTAGVSHSYR